MSEFTRIAMGISYRGCAYNGWQRQPHCPDTVQGHLEAALSQVANAPIETTCAGRTDSGVHGTGQVIHFDTPAQRSEYGWKMGVNTNLNKDIRVNWVREVDADFHARFSANSRRYHYVIEDDSVGNALFHQLITPCRQPLDAEAMHEAGQYLLGEQDFSSFRAAQCQSNTAFRHVDFVRVSRHGAFVVVDIQANAFLYHMVRNIVGALLLVGQGKCQPAWVGEVLAAKDRRQAPATAPADGLYLVDVGYKDYAFPAPPALPFV